MLFFFLHSKQFTKYTAQYAVNQHSVPKIVHFMPDTTISLPVSLEWFSLLSALLHTFHSNHIAYLY